MPDPYLVRLEDPHIEKQASEASYDWSGDQVVFELFDRSQAVERRWKIMRERQEGGGLFALRGEGATHAAVTEVRRVGPHRVPLRWRIAGGSVVGLQRGVEKLVSLSTRLRLSLWAFVPPFGKKLANNDVLFDAGLLDLLYQANVDDLSLVTTITWDKRDKAGGQFKPPKWQDGFKPLGSGAHRVAYLKRLIHELHKRDVQLLVGYEMVKRTVAAKDMTSATKQAAARYQDFADWLEKASAGEIAGYAEAIQLFFEKQGIIGLDGVGFDFEFDELNDKHRANMALLCRKTSESLRGSHGIVSYANAPLTQDGVHPYGFMRAQPFSLAAAGPNILARPMCFDDTKNSSFDVVKQSIACALRKTSDNKGGGLHPSQVQYGIWSQNLPSSQTALKQGIGEMERWCQELLRPNRVGLMIYNLPSEHDKAEKLLRDCVKYDRALNPGEALHGQPLQPLQVTLAGGRYSDPVAFTVSEQ